jgi:ketosteroid isomerase-like protein
MRALVILVLTSLLIASCSQAPDNAKIKAEVEALLAKAAADMTGGTIDTTMSQYADDPWSLPNNGPMLHGKAALKEYYGKMMQMGITFSSVKFTNVDVSAAGKFVNDVGTYEMTMEIPGMGSMTDKGKYITVYERGADGALKIKYETWNTDTMPPMPEPAPAAGEKGKKM